MMAYSVHKLQRSRRGKIFGICQGIADWRDLPVEYIRIFLILAFLFTGFFPVGILYFLAALFLPLEPDLRGDDNQRRQDNIRRDFSDLKERVKNMESRVFDKERDWEDRFRREKK
jgi:phage shock protein C